jgi:hypothetical protein
MLVLVRCGRDRQAGRRHRPVKQADGPLLGADGASYHAGRDRDDRIEREAQCLIAAGVIARSEEPGEVPGPGETATAFVCRFTDGFAAGSRRSRAPRTTSLPTLRCR